MAFSTEEIQTELENDLLDDSESEAEGETVNDFDDFADLIASGEKNMQEKAELKAKKKLLALGGLTATETEQIRAYVEAAENAKIWDDVCNVARFVQQTCACGAESTFFVQFLLEQKHRREEGARRWVAELVPKGGDLPKKVVYQKTQSLICPHCAAGSGWDFTNATEFH